MHFHLNDGRVWFVIITKIFKVTQKSIIFSKLFSVYTNSVLQIHLFGILKMFQYFSNCVYPVLWGACLPMDKRQWLNAFIYRHTVKMLSYVFVAFLFRTDLFWFIYLLTNQLSNFKVRCNPNKKLQRELDRVEWFIRLFLGRLFIHCSMCDVWFWYFTAEEH